MPEILYSDIEVTAKVVMDPRTMETACNQIEKLLDRVCSSGNRQEYAALERVQCEMQQVLSRLAEMHMI